MREAVGKDIRTRSGSLQTTVEPGRVRLTQYSTLPHALVPLVVDPVGARELASTLLEAAAHAEALEAAERERRERGAA